MNLLLAIFKYFPFGGLQNDMLRIALEAATRNHQVTIATTQWKGEQPQVQNLNIKFLQPKGFSNHGEMENFASQVRELSQQEDFDVTFALNRLPGCDWYFAADDCLATELPRKHGKLALNLLPRYRSMLKVERELFDPQKKTQVMYISQQQKLAFMKTYGMPEERFHLLPPGMNPACVRPDEETAQQRRRQKRQELGLSPQHLAIISIGANLMLKGADRTIQAINQLPPELSKNIRLILVGQHNPALLKLADCPDHILMLGPRKDVPDLLLAADLMIHPARQEAAGSVLIEAIAAGIPVICSQACGFQNYVRLATGLVTAEPFQQQELNQMTAQAVQTLEQLTRQTRDYAATQDFTARAKVAVNLLESAQPH